MLRIAIIEQNQPLQELLRRYIEKYAEEYGEPCFPVWIGDELEFLDNYTFCYDVVIIDTELRYLSGIEAAKKIRHADSHVEILFCSSNVEQAVFGYEVGAVDFLIQPVRYDRFARALQKASVRCQSKERRTIILKAKDSFRRIRIAEIRFVEVRGHMLGYHLYGETIQVSGQLSAVEPLLAACGRFRCSVSYMIAPRSVERYTGRHVYIGGQEIPVSRAQKQALFALLRGAGRPEGEGALPPVMADGGAAAGLPAAQGAPNV